MFEGDSGLEKRGRRQTNRKTEEGKKEQDKTAGKEKSRPDGHIRNPEKNNINLETDPRT